MLVYDKISPGQFCSVECRDQYSILFKSKTVCPCYRTPTQLRFHCYMPRIKNRKTRKEKKETKKDDKKDKEKKETKKDNEDEEKKELKKMTKET